MADKLKVTLIKSTIGATPKQKKIVESMGLKKMHQSVILKDNAMTRGAVSKVPHMVSVEEQ